MFHECENKIFCFLQFREKTPVERLQLYTNERDGEKKLQRNTRSRVVLSQ